MSLADFDGNGWLAGAHVPACLTAFDGPELLRLDIELREGRIEAIVPPGAGEAAGPVLDLDRGMVWPGFVDAHTHLDKGHIWPRMPNPDGSFMGALTAAGTDRMAFWTSADVKRRMEFGLRTAYAHGTRAIRTHLDSIFPQDAISWDVFCELRDEWAGRIELQAASLVGIEALRDHAWAMSLADRVARAGGIFGAVTYMVPDLAEQLDRIFITASQRGLDLDFHADETDDVAAVSLRMIAEAALRNRFEGKILVGHCCSLALQPDADVLRTLDLVARAGIAVVSLPMCNLYLQDRRANATTPRWRGVTLAHEMKARGIPVSVASDNTRDPFHAYGDLDMLEVYRMATRIMHFDHPVADWPRAVGATPAAAMGLPQPAVIAKGRAADLVVFRGRSWTELLSRPESDRAVVRDGAAIKATVPDYSELDHLFGAP